MWRVVLKRHYCSSRTATYKYENRVDVYKAITIAPACFIDRASAELSNAISAASSATRSETEIRQGASRIAAHRHTDSPPHQRGRNSGGTEIMCGR